MGYKFLDKVVDQIMSETRIDYDKERVYTPFSPPLSSYSRLIYLIKTTSFHPPPTPLTPQFFVPSFPHHCKEVYGLNDEEIEYVWRKYLKELIKDKLNNG